jgi:GT2 family glycosyltransferase
VQRPVSVIIPVYDAFASARACLRSVIAHSPQGVRVLVIDDASPSGSFQAALPAEVLSDSRLTVRRNSQNQGFVRSCNAGIELAGSDDVVLLNSDTLVSAHWLEKLQAAAYSRPRIGTVTPLTNNGTICSFPRFGASNPLPTFCSLAQLSEIVEIVSRRAYAELPTCVGFCLYIKRELIERIGVFDAEAFGRGYGEENDFSCRAQAAGYVDILDDATFVYHKGEQSFGKEKEALIQANSEILRRRHPHYFDCVARFYTRDTLEPIRLRIMDALALSHLSCDHFFDKLNENASDWPSYLQCREDISMTKVISTAEEAKQYGELYAQCCASQTPRALDDLMEFLAAYGLAHAPGYPLAIRLCIKAVGKLVWWLDSLEVRGQVEKQAEKLLPKHLINFLKRAHQLYDYFFT